MADGRRITVLGGSGYTGGWIAREAAARGHVVTAISRHAPAERLDGVTYVEADATDEAVLDRAVEADVIVAALSPRGGLTGALFPLYAKLAKRSAAAHARLVVIGGFSSLRPAPGAPRFSDGALDPRFAAEATEMARVLDWLPTSDPELDWVYVSPAAQFGSYNPGERTGHYRLGDDVALTNADGSPTSLSGADLAIAIVDLAESDSHRREHVSVAN